MSAHLAFDATAPHPAEQAIAVLTAFGQLGYDAGASMMDEMPEEVRAHGFMCLCLGLLKEMERGGMDPVAAMQRIALRGATHG